MYIAAILNLFQIVPLGSTKTCTYITLSRKSVSQYIHELPQQSPEIQQC
jgi:hypothetical protein